MTLPADPNSEKYCPRLGHAVTLAYCVREGIDRPCRLVFRCWEGRLPIREHLLTLYKESDLEIIDAPASKISSILDIIARAQRTSEGPDAGSGT